MIIGKPETIEEKPLDWGKPKRGRPRLMTSKPAELQTVTAPPPDPNVIPELRSPSFLQRWHKKYPDDPPKPSSMKIMKAVRMGKVDKPAIDKVWTTLYYGHRGASKSLEQARQLKGILEYLTQLYTVHPELHRSIVYSVQRLNPELTAKYSSFIYYWLDIRELRYCPRKNCWRGIERHRLHGCYLVFDDIAAILPANAWQNTPTWFIQMLSQARKFGIRIVANCQDPFSIDINFRRYVDMCYRVRKIIGSPDPDETKPPVKYIWGWYHLRAIKAELLWQMGDMSENEIIVFKDKNKRMSEVNKTPNLMKDVWRGKIRWISRKTCEIFDTTQQVKEYKPAGYQHLELNCNDPEHPNCGYKKVTHELI